MLASLAAVQPGRADRSLAGRERIGGVLERLWGSARALVRRLAPSARLGEGGYVRMGSAGAACGPRGRAGVVRRSRPRGLARVEFRRCCADGGGASRRARAAGARARGEAGGRAGLRSAATLPCGSGAPLSRFTDAEGCLPRRPPSDRSPAAMRRRRPPFTVQGVRPLLRGSMRWRRAPGRRVGGEGGREWAWGGGKEFGAGWGFLVLGGRGGARGGVGSARVDWAMGAGLQRRAARRGRRRKVLAVGDSAGVECGEIGADSSESRRRRGGRGGVGARTHHNGRLPGVRRLGSLHGCSFLYSGGAMARRTRIGRRRWRW